MPITHFQPPDPPEVPAPAIPPALPELSPDVVEARRTNGETLRSIAASYGLSRQALGDLRRKWGLAPIAAAHRARVPWEQRFRAKVRRSAGCWLWQASVDHNGYGQFFPKPNQMRLAHRVAWELANGPIPSGMGVLHRCDTPRCVNPAHLFLGDQSANMQDCATKDRTTRGERNAQAKLTAGQVQVIRQQLAAGEHPAVLATAYGVKESTIRDIRSRRNWRHLP